MTNNFDIMIFDQARWVRIDDVYELAYIWYGGHTIHVYDLATDGCPEVDIFCIGDFALDEAELMEVQEAIEEKITELYEDDEDTYEEGDDNGD